MGYFLLGALLIAVIYNSAGPGLAITMLGAALGALFARVITLEQQRSRRDAPDSMPDLPQPRAEYSPYSPRPEPAQPAPPPLPTQKPHAEPLAPPPLAQAPHFKARQADEPELEATPLPTPPSQRIPVAESTPQNSPKPARAQYAASEPQVQAAPWHEQPNRAAYTAPSEPMPDLPNLPDWAKSLLSLENWPIKLGMLLLLIGLASGYRYLSERGYLNVPIELRLLSVMLLAIAALVFGYGKRESKRSFALSVQGGALGAMLLTVYAALQLYGVLDAKVAFAVMLAIVATGVVLAVLQDAVWLALFATLGGFAAPILASTGKGSYIQLFSYYLLLNLGVLAISLKKGWRSLNILGALCTFGIGITWGVNYYRPEYFSSVEPFLLAFFAIYLAITVLYTLRHGDDAPVLDGILVFGVPMATLFAQAGLLAGDDRALAMSTFVGSLIYGGLYFALQGRESTQLLRRCFLGLAVALFTLSIPLYFSAQVTSALWALEGAAVLWLGIKQQRVIPMMLGAALQVLAWLAYFDGYAAMSVAPALSNGRFLGAMVIALASFACAVFLQRARMSTVLAVLAGLFWWSFASLGEIERSVAQPLRLAALMMWLGANATLCAFAARQLKLPTLRIGAFVAIVLFPVLVWGVHESTPIFANYRGLGILTLLIGCAAAIALMEAERQHADEAWSNNEFSALKLAQSIWLFGVTLLVYVYVELVTRGLGEGLRFALCSLPFVATYALLVLATPWVGFPLQKSFAQPDLSWRNALLVCWSVGIVLLWYVGVFLFGKSDPLPYLPVLNPLSLLLLAIIALVYQSTKDRSLDAQLHMRWLSVAMLFVLLSTDALRFVAHRLNPELTSLWASFISRNGQAALTIAWSLLGCGAMLYGNAKMRRPLWLGGAALMGIVIVKMFFVDRHNLGELAGIFATLGVGALLAAVGYFAPAPPADART